MPGTSTGRDLHIDRPLSQIAMRYRPDGFIADMIAPSVPVMKQSDSFYVWDIADVFRVVDDYRAPGREALGITRSISSATYFCKNYALKEDVLYEDIANADAKEIFGSRAAAAEAVLDKLYLNWEYRVAKSVTSGTNCGSYSATASAWSDATNSNPIGNIDTAIDNVAGVTGIRPNSIIFGQQAWKSFKRHTAVISALFGNSAVGSARVPGEAGIKALFNFERVLVGGTFYNTGAENQAATLANLWDDQVLVYYAPLAARKDKPSFMYSFDWNQVNGFNRQAQVFDRPRHGKEEVQVGYFQDEKITGKTLSFLITGVNSAQ